MILWFTGTPPGGPDGVLVGGPCWGPQGVVAFSWVSSGTQILGGETPKLWAKGGFLSFSTVSSWLQNDRGGTPKSRSASSRQVFTNDKVTALEQAPAGHGSGAGAWRSRHWSRRLRVTAVEQAARAREAGVRKIQGARPPPGDFRPPEELGSGRPLARRASAKGAEGDFAPASESPDKSLTEDV